MNFINENEMKLSNHIEFYFVHNFEIFQFRLKKLLVLNEGFIKKETSFTIQHHTKTFLKNPNMSTPLPPRPRTLFQMKTPEGQIYYLDKQTNQTYNQYPPDVIVVNEETKQIIYRPPQMNQPPHLQNPGQRNGPPPNYYPPGQQPPKPGQPNPQQRPPYQPNQMANRPPPQYHPGQPAPNSQYRPGPQGPPPPNYQSRPGQPPGPPGQAVPPNQSTHQGQPNHPPSQAVQGGPPPHPGQPNQPQAPAIQRSPPPYPNQPGQQGPSGQQNIPNRPPPQGYHPAPNRPNQPPNAANRPVNAPPSQPNASNRPYYSNQPNQPNRPVPPNLQGRPGQPGPNQIPPGARPVGQPPYQQPGQPMNRNPPYQQRGPPNNQPNGQRAPNAQGQPMPATQYPPNQQGARPPYSHPPNSPPPPHGPTAQNPPHPNPSPAQGQLSSSSQSIPPQLLQQSTINQDHAPKMPGPTDQPTNLVSPGQHNPMQHHTSQIPRTLEPDQIDKGRTSNVAPTNNNSGFINSSQSPPSSDQQFPTLSSDYEKKSVSNAEVQGEKNVQEESENLSALSSSDDESQNENESDHQEEQEPEPVHEDNEIQQNETAQNAFTYTENETTTFIDNFPKDGNQTNYQDQILVSTPSCDNLQVSEESSNHVSFSQEQLGEPPQSFDFHFAQQFSSSQPPPQIVQQQQQPPPSNAQFTQQFAASQSTPIPPQNVSMPSDQAPVPPTSVPLPSDQPPIPPSKVPLPSDKPAQHHSHHQHRHQETSEQSSKTVDDSSFYSSQNYFESDSKYAKRNRKPSPTAQNVTELYLTDEPVLLAEPSIPKTLPAFFDYTPLEIDNILYFPPKQSYFAAIKENTKKYKELISQAQSQPNRQKDPHYLCNDVDPDVTYNPIDVNHKRKVGLRERLCMIMNIKRTISKDELLNILNTTYSYLRFGETNFRPFNGGGKFKKLAVTALCQFDPTPLYKPLLKTSPKEKKDIVTIISTSILNADTAKLYDMLRINDDLIDETYALLIKLTTKCPTIEQELKIWKCFLIVGCNFLPTMYIRFQVLAHLYVSGFNNPVNAIRSIARFIFIRMNNLFALTSSKIDCTPDDILYLPYYAFYSLIMFDTNLYEIMYSQKRSFPDLPISLPLYLVVRSMIHLKIFETHGFIEQYRQTNKDKLDDLLLKVLEMLPYDLHYLEQIEHDPNIDSSLKLPLMIHVLKYWLGSLLIPIIPTEYTDPVVEKHGLKPAPQLINTLPATNLRHLGYLVGFFKELNSHSAKTGANPSMIAQEFALHLFIRTHNVLLLTKDSRDGLEQHAISFIASSIKQMNTSKFYPINPLYLTIPPE